MIGRPPKEEMSTNSEFSSMESNPPSSDFTFPHSKVVSEEWEALLKNEYSNGHQVNIHSLSKSSDGESFLTADVLRVNIWNLETNQAAYSIVENQP